MEYTPNINLTEIFTKFAAKAIEDFPQLKDKLVIFSAPTRDFYGEAVTHSTDISLEEKREMHNLIKKTIGASDTPPSDHMFKDGQIRGYAFPMHMYTLEKNATFEVIALGRIGIDNRIMSSSAEPFQQEVRNVLEHELGHIVAPGGRDYLYQGEQSHENPDSHKQESVADTFALLRQIQRNESIDRVVEAAAFSRSTRLVLFSEADHVTTPALLAVREMAKAMDISKLSPKETADLASRIARDNTPSAAEMAEIKKIYEPVLETYKSHGFLKALEKCSDVMLADHGTHTRTVYDIGKSFMQPLLDNRQEIMFNIFSIDDMLSGQLNLQGEQWDDARKGIAARDGAYQLEEAGRASELKSRFMAQKRDVPSLPTKNIDQKQEYPQGLAMHTLYRP